MIKNKSLYIHSKPRDGSNSMEKLPTMGSVELALKSMEDKQPYTHTTVTATVEPDDDDSDQYGRTTTAHTVHTTDGEGVSPVMFTSARTTTTSSDDRPTSDFKASDCTDCSKCTDGWSGPFICFCGATCGFMEHLWITQNKICMVSLIMITLITCIGLLGWMSARYEYRLENPSEFHYTSCMIKDIRKYKESDSDEDYEIELTFLYGFTNLDWEQEGKYSLSEDDWNDLKRDGMSDGYQEGDIGTCVYSIDPNFHDEFTIQNYLIHQDTSAMWLILDNKFGLIAWIIFFVFSVIFVGICAAVYFGNGMEYAEFVMSGFLVFAAFVGGNVSVDIY